MYYSAQASRTRSRTRVANAPAPFNNALLCTWQARPPHRKADLASETPFRCRMGSIPSLHISLIPSDPTEENNEHGRRLRSNLLTVRLTFGWPGPPLWETNNYHVMWWFLAVPNQVIDLLICARSTTITWGEKRLTTITSHDRFNWFDFPTRFSTSRQAVANTR